MIKKTAFISLMSLTLVLMASWAQALPKDACYDLFRSNNNSGAICFGGWEEESIGGQVIRVALVDMSGNTYYCARSTQVSFDVNTANAYSLRLKMPTMTLQLKGKVTDGEEQGELLQGGSSFQYLPLSPETNRRVYQGAFSSPKCN